MQEDRIGTSVKLSVRKILRQTHIAAIAVAMLTATSVQWLMIVVWAAASNAITRFAGPGHIYDWSEFFHHIAADFGLQPMLLSLLGAATQFGIASLLSYSVYGAGTIEALSANGKTFVRQRHA